MIIYIAGPMTGHENFNHPEFMVAERVLRRIGHVPINPAHLPTTLRHEAYMPICMAMIDAADAICLLPGWENSDGAKLESAYAKHQKKKAYTLTRDWMLSELTGADFRQEVPREVAT